MMPLLMADGLVPSRRSLCRGAAFAGSCLALPALAAMKSYSPAEAAGAASRLRQSRSALDEVKAAVDAKQFDQALTLLQSQPLAGFEADCTMLVQSSVLDVEDKKVPRASDFPPAVGPEGRHVLTHARSPPLAACRPSLRTARAVLDDRHHPALRCRRRRADHARRPCKRRHGKGRGCGAELHHEGHGRAGRDPDHHEGLQGPPEVRIEDPCSVRLPNKANGHAGLVVSAYECQSERCRRSACRRLGRAKNRTARLSHRVMARAHLALPLSTTSVADRRSRGTRHSGGDTRHFQEW